MPSCHIKSVPLWLTATTITSLNALVFGLDTGTIGSVTALKAFQDTFGAVSGIIRGVVVSSILLPGAIAALVAGVLADRYGRTRMIAAGSIIFGVGGVLEAAASRLAVFLAGRLVKGAGEGIFLSTVYVQVCEMSPARVRGVMNSVPQFCTVLGLVLGFFLCYATSGLDGSLAWRLPVAVQAVVAFANAALGACLVPPSPRWLLAKGRSEQASAVIARLGLEETEKEELLAQQPGRLGGGGAAELTLRQSLRQAGLDFREAFAPQFRARTLFGCYLMAMQQFSGIDGVLYYAPILLRRAGIESQQASFLASAVTGLVLLAATVPGTLLADAWGRRTSTLFGGVLITLVMFVIGTLYATGQVHTNDGPGRWVVMVCIYLFAAVFSFTWAIGFRTFLIESLPMRTRSSAASLAQTCNWNPSRHRPFTAPSPPPPARPPLEPQLANYIVALTTPVFLDSCVYGAYYFFALCSLLCTVTCFFLMVETRGHSLERIEMRYADRKRDSASGRPGPTGGDGDGDGDGERVREREKSLATAAAVVVVVVAE